MAMEGFVDWRGNAINKKRHGGVRAALFTQFMVAMASMTFIPLAFNLVTYLHDKMHTGIAKSSTITTNFIGATCAFALVGAFVSDSYITRFKTMLIFGPFELLGYGLLALQAHLPSLQPPSCNTTTDQISECQQVHGFKLALFYTGLYTVALGEGCMRACLASFGGDQFDSEDPVESRLQSSSFSWYTFGISIGGFTGLILIVWLDSNKGWDYGFGVSAIAFLIGLLVLAGGFPLYRNHKPKGSPITRIMQVFVAAFRKRNLKLPETLELEEAPDTEVLSHTKGLRCLDKACINDKDSRAWSLCTVTQVEETKILLRMVPIFITSVLNYAPNFVLLTFTVQQGNAMNTKVGKIRISPATLFIVPIALQMVILVVYDRLFVPFARKITGHPGGITHFQRVGVGYVGMILACCIAAIIEKKRLKTAEEGNASSMSVLWLTAQFVLLGITDATAFPGMLEFFNSEVSRGMKSLGTAIFWCMLGLASLMSTFLNQSRLDRFYWFIFAFGGASFFVHLYFARRYVYRRDPRVTDELCAGLFQASSP